MSDFLDEQFLDRIYGINKIEFSQKRTRALIAKS